MKPSIIEMPPILEIGTECCFLRLGSSNKLYFFEIFIIKGLTRALEDDAKKNIIKKTKSGIDCSVKLNY